MSGTPHVCVLCRWYSKRWFRNAECTCPTIIARFTYVDRVTGKTVVRRPTCKSLRHGESPYKNCCHWEPKPQGIEPETPWERE